MEEPILAELSAKRYQSAFEGVLSLFQHKVTRLAYSILGDWSLAEETAQEVFVRVWKALPSFRGQSSLSTWIFTITRNTSITAARQRARAKTLSIDEPAVLRAAEQKMEQPEEPVDIPALLALLPEQYRRVLSLYYVEGKSYQETADMLGLTMGTVKIYMHRARKDLAKLVKSRE